MLSLIAAMTYDHVIGSKGSMPWHLPADFSWFRYHTMGKPVLMGRTTWLSIGRALPKRYNIVISRSMAASLEKFSLEESGIEVASSPEQALQFARQKGDQEMMVIGGAQIYDYYLPSADRLYLTYIDAQLSGDTWFPDYQRSAQWNTLDKITCKANKQNAYDCTFLIMERASCNANMSS